MDDPIESPNVSRRSVPPILVILAASLIVVVALPIAVFVSGTIAQSQQLDADTRALQTLLRRELPAGTTLARTLAMLSSRDVARFLTAHRYHGPYPDLPFQRVRSYDATVDASQAFPGGRVLEASVTQDWDRGITLFFAYDRHGRLIRVLAQKDFIPTIG